MPHPHMTPRTMTMLMMVTNLFFCIVWDIVVYRMAGSTATISRIMWDWVSGYPGLAIAIGALIGHFWFSQQGIAPAH